MAGTSYPFSGDTLSPAEWGQMARLWQRNGVVAGYGSQLEVIISGSDAIIGTGSLWLHGHVYINNATDSVTLLAGANYICAVVDSNPTDISFTTQAYAPSADDKRKVLLAYYNSGTLQDYRTWAGQTYLSLIVGTGANTITAGKAKVALPIPYDAKIVKWEIIADVSGALSAQILSTDYASWTATAGANILSVSISAGNIKASSHPCAPVDAPDITIRAGNYIRTNVVSVSTINQAVISLLLAPIQVNA